MTRYLFIFLILATSAFAVEPGEMLDDPVLEERAREISKGLRCLVCRNENIDDSNADLARDLRILVRDRILAGDTDEQVTDFVVDRYGQYVLLKPVFSKSNATLWLAGPILFFLGGIATLLFIRQRSTAPAPIGVLSKEEQNRLASLLDD